MRRGRERISESVVRVGPPRSLSCVTEGDVSLSDCPDFSVVYVHMRTIYQVLPETAIAKFTAVRCWRRHFNHFSAQGRKD